MVRKSALFEKKLTCFEILTFGNLRFLYLRKVTFGILLCFSLEISFIKALFMFLTNNGMYSGQFEPILSQFGLHEIFNQIRSLVEIFC